MGLLDSAVEMGLKLYDKNKKREELPSNKRVFLETVLDGNRDPITEKNLSKAEQEAIQKLIVSKYEPLKEPLGVYKQYLEESLNKHQEAIKAKNSGKQMNPTFLVQYQRDLKAIKDFEQGKVTKALTNLASGKFTYEQQLGLFQSGAVRGKEHPFQINSNVQYPDYERPTGDQHVNANARTLGSGENPYHSLATLLGRFNYDADDNGNISIKDRYDFNPPESIFGGTSASKRQGVQEHQAEGMAGGFYGAVRAYAGAKVPQGQGRDVIVNLPYTDPFKPTIK